MIEDPLDDHVYRLPISSLHQTYPTESYRNTGTRNKTFADSLSSPKSMQPLHTDASILINSTTSNYKVVQPLAMRER